MAAGPTRCPCSKYTTSSVCRHSSRTTKLKIKSRGPEVNQARRRPGPYVADEVRHRCDVPKQAGARGRSKDFGDACVDDRMTSYRDHRRPSSSLRRCQAITMTFFCLACWLQINDSCRFISSQTGSGFPRGGTRNKPDAQCFQTCLWCHVSGHATRGTRHAHVKL